LLKLDSESGKKHSVSSVVKRHFDLSVREPKEGIDLIIWPETSYPLLLSAEKMRKDKRFIPSAIKNVIRETGADVFFGGYDRAKGKTQGTFKSEYNSAFLISSSGEFVNSYHKHKLIPFGEGLPFGPLNQFLSRYINNISFFAKGDTFPLFETKNDSSFISAICYEILFSSFIRNYLNGLNKQPQFLINLTNDSWYGDTLEPYQHLFLSHWRAIEFDIPIIRMTNTGISSILYPDGREDKRTNLFKKVSKDYTFIYKSKRVPTFFQKWGLMPLCLLSIILISLQGLIHIFEKKKFALQPRKEKPSFKRS
jgi:apolipoprotein N-acyltransferase